MNKTFIRKLGYFLLILFLISEPLILVSIVINLKDSYEIIPIEYTSEHIYAVKSRSKNSTIDYIMPLNYEYDNFTINMSNVTFPPVENPEIKEVRIIFLNTFIHKDIKRIVVSFNAEQRPKIAPVEVGVSAAEKIISGFWIETGQNLYVQSGKISDETIVDISMAQAYYLEYVAKYIIIYFKFNPNISMDGISLTIHIEFYYGKVSLPRFIKAIYVGIFFITINLVLITLLFVLRNGSNLSVNYSISKIDAKNRKFMAHNRCK